MENRIASRPFRSSSRRPLCRLLLTRLLLVGTVCILSPGKALGAPAAHVREIRRQAPADLAYREALDHLVVVPVYLDGRGPYDLILDTGAIFTTIEPSLAAELGLERLGSIPVVSVAGNHQGSRGRLDRMELGPFSVSGVDVVWSEMDFLPSVDPEIRGILGQSALRHLSFGIDHRRRRILFERPEKSDAALPLVYCEGRPAVSFRPVRSEAELTVVLDSGAAFPMLFDKPGVALPTRSRSRGDFETKTVSGEARLPIVQLEGRVGGVRIPGTPTAVQDDRVAGGREEDGLLPTQLFRIVYFDHPENQILLRR